MPVFLIAIDPRLKQLGDDWRKWFDSRLDDAIEAANNQEQPEIESKPIICHYISGNKSVKFDQIYCSIHISVMTVKHHTSSANESKNN